MMQSIEEWLFTLNMIWVFPCSKNTLNAKDQTATQKSLMAYLFINHRNLVSYQWLLLSLYLTKIEIKLDKIPPVTLQRSESPKTFLNMSLTL